MVSGRLLLFLAFTAGALASPFTRRNATRRVCGTNVTDEDIQVAEQDFQAKVAQLSTVLATDAADAATNISVHFHVVSEDESLSGGNVPDSQIQEQIDVLNVDYADACLTFSLASVTRTVNGEWFNSVSPNTALETDMKSTLHEGGAADLNVYTVGFTSEGLLGYSTLPGQHSSDSTDDGVVILFSSLPGGTMEAYDQGHTLTHEVGHWVGLYHTFQGGCSGSGDLVDDTPAEAEPSDGCPVGRDTCSSEGVDPIHNFMDYSYDACLNNFTPGQITRLTEQISIYRGL